MRLYLIRMVSCSILFFLEMKNGWLIKTRSKSFAVYAATNTEKKEWMLHIERCVHDILTKGMDSLFVQYFYNDRLFQTVRCYSLICVICVHFVILRIFCR